jgi:CelD/BcsL family acetyltransferase involved in cellulose biosynthesis
MFHGAVASCPPNDMHQIQLTFRCNARLNRRLFLDGEPGNSMSLTDDRKGQTGGIPDDSRVSIASLEVHDSIKGLAQEWESLEKTGFATPYQTFAWSRAWIETLGAVSGLDFKFVRLIDSMNQTAAILPMGIATSVLGRKAIFPGGKHSNFNMMLFGSPAMTGLQGADLLAALKRVAVECDIDCFHFIHQPRQWNGLDNPLLTLPMQASANTAYRADLLPDGEAMIRSLMSSESRKKLRNKEKRIGEFGLVSFQKAETDKEIERILAVFLEQKAARFKNQGLDNPFASSEAAEFLRRGALPEGGSKPSFSLFYLSAGERVLSVLGGADHAGRMSGMFTSFDDAPDIARYSPGDLLLLHLVKHLSNNGYSVFDLGTGDAAYKGDYCKIEEPLFDTILPMTTRGRVLSACLRMTYGVKRWIKHNPRALKIVRRLR